MQKMTPQNKKIIKIVLKILRDLINEIIKITRCFKEKMLQIISFNKLNHEEKNQQRHRKDIICDFKEAVIYCKHCDFLKLIMKANDSVWQELKINEKLQESLNYYHTYFISNDEICNVNGVFSFIEGNETNSSERLIKEGIEIDLNCAIMAKKTNKYDLNEKPLFLYPVRSYNKPKDKIDLCSFCIGKEVRRQFGDEFESIVIVQNRVEKELEKVEELRIFHNDLLLLQYKRFKNESNQI